MAAKPEGVNVSSRNVKILAVVVVVLFATLFVLNPGDRSEPSTNGDLLFPELKSRLNDISLVTITDADGEIALRREANDESDSTTGRWVAPAYDGYPVDTGSLRQLLLAIADARKIEQKTSDPGLYERLGVQDPRENDGNGVLVSARGDNAAVALILGDAAQGEFRYARIPEESRSWLISRNPVLPAEPAGWLLPAIVDIDASRIQSAVVRHPDGEVISLKKTNPDDVDFAVANVPEGRELRYPSIANSIAAVVSNLTLEDVRRAGDGADQGLQADSAVTAEFRTFDGLELQVTLRRGTADASDTPPAEAGSDSETETHWITLKATADAAPADAAPSESPETPDASGDASQARAADEAEAGATDESGAEATGNPAEEAAGINERVSGWAYRIASYKGDQLARRWDDLLSEPESEASD
jgi:hypothetical protein